MPEYKLDIDHDAPDHDRAYCMTCDNRSGAVLACPHCGNADLWSDEVASIMYTVRLTRGDDGGVDVDYTGVASEPQDEGTVYAGDIWCRACGTQLTESELVTEVTP